MDDQIPGAEKQSTCVFPAGWPFGSLLNLFPVPLGLVGSMTHRMGLSPTSALAPGRQPTENTDPLKATELFSVSEVPSHRRNRDESILLFYLKNNSPKSGVKNRLRSRADGDMRACYGEFAVGGSPK